MDVRNKDGNLDMDLVNMVTSLCKKEFGEMDAGNLYNLIKKFVKSYDDQVENEGDKWLNNTLGMEYSDVKEEEIQTMSSKIQQSVDIWEENMASLKEACEQGISKEEWLADKLQEASIGSGVSEYGRDLSVISSLLHASNQRSISEIDGKKFDAGAEQNLVSDVIAKDSEDEWNTYKVHALAAQLGKEVDVSNMAGLITGKGREIAESVLDDESAGIPRIADALQNGNDRDLKIAVTAALKKGIESGYVPLMPQNTPLAMVSGVACFGVEQAKSILQYANGEISARKALEDTGRSAIVMVAHPLSKRFEAIGEHLGQKIGQKAGMLLASFIPALTPVAGVVGGFIGVAVGRMAGSLIGKAIHTGIEKLVSVAVPVMKKAWEGIKSVGKTIVDGIKSVWDTLLG